MDTELNHLYVKLETFYKQDMYRLVTEPVLDQLWSNLERAMDDFQSGAASTICDTIREYVSDNVEQTKWGFNQEEYSFMMKAASNVVLAVYLGLLSVVKKVLNPSQTQLEVDHNLHTLKVTLNGNRPLRLDAEEVAQFCIPMNILEDIVNYGSIKALLTKEIINDDCIWYCIEGEIGDEVSRGSICLPDDRRYCSFTDIAKGLKDLDNSEQGPLLDRLVG